MRILRFGILTVTAVIGVAQIRNYRPPAPKTAAPDMVELGGPEWGFAHSNPTFLASFNLTELLKSPVGQWILSQVGRALSLNAAELDKLRMVLGEIDHISASAQPKTARQMDGVILLTGHFENHLLTKLIQVSGGPAPRMLDGNTMLLGDNDSVEAALRRISNSWKTRRTDALIQRARNLTAAYDFWITGPAPPELSAALAPGGIRSFTLGMGLGRQMRVVLALDTWTQQGAERILASYRRMEAAGRRSPQLAAQWEQMNRGLRIENLSPGIQFSIIDARPIPDAVLSQLGTIPMFQAPSGSSSVKAALAALDTSSAAASKSAPANGKIVILGADGVKEVTVK
jgi:hypothetical protein